MYHWEYGAAAVFRGDDLGRNILCADASLSYSDVFYETELSKIPVDDESSFNLLSKRPISVFHGKRPIFKGMGTAQGRAEAFGAVCALVAITMAAKKYWRILGYETLRHNDRFDRFGALTLR